MTKEQDIQEQRRLAKLDLEIAADRLSSARRELTKAERVWKAAQMKYFNLLPPGPSDVKRS